MRVVEAGLEPGAAPGLSYAGSGAAAALQRIPGSASLGPPRNGMGQRDSSPAGCWTGQCGTPPGLIYCAWQLSPVPGTFVMLGCFLLQVQAAGSGVCCDRRVVEQPDLLGHLWDELGSSVTALQGAGSAQIPPLSRENTEFCCELCAHRQAVLSSQNAGQKCPLHSDSWLIAPPELQTRWVM